MIKPAAIRYMRSAGGVLWRAVDGRMEVALIATRGASAWTLPKGIINRDEKPEEAAVREIIEETGLTGNIVCLLGEKSYWFFLKSENAKCKKTVTYFLLDYVSGDITSSSPEVDDAKWIELDTAAQMLTYGSDREILSAAKERLTNG